jgi:hypothetical protein
MHTWKDNIKIYLKRECKGLDRIRVIEDRVQCLTFEHGYKHSSSIKGGEIIDYLSDC